MFRDTFPCQAIKNENSKLTIVNIERQPDFFFGKSSNVEEVKLKI